MRILNFVNFKKIIYVKIYNQLILSKIQKCKKKCKALKKRNKLYIQDVFCHVKKLAITDHLRRHDQSNHIATLIAAALNCSGNGLIRGVPPQHRLSAQRWADGMNMWPNVVRTFKRPLPGVYVYKKFVWVSVRLIKMWVKNIF